MEQVTKSKNEGRVAAGKRLVEWNRKNKEDLLKNREQVATSDPPSQQENVSQATSSVFYSGGALLVAGIAVIFLWKQRGTSKVTSDRSAVEQENDIFSMN